MEETQIQKTKSPKIAFIFGILVGVTIFSLIAFVLLAINMIQERGCETSAPKKEEQRAEEQTPVDPQGMEAKIIGQVGTFYEVSEPICRKNNKPLVFMFSTSWCPHCQWAKPMFESAVKDYVKKGKIIAHQWELDTGDDILTTVKETTVNSEDEILYRKYNPQGSIPTFIFGCKYFRIGTGHERSGDKAAEEKEFKEIIEKLLK